MCISLLELSSEYAHLADTIASDPGPLSVVGANVQQSIFKKCALKTIDGQQKALLEPRVVRAT